MNGVVFPEGLRLVPLERNQSRRDFDSGNSEVNDWLKSKALQHQEKHLSVTRVLLSPKDMISGYYTLATGQVDFGDLPHALARKLPRRTLPVAILAWLGVDLRIQNRGVGDRLLAQALRDCFEAGQTFAFVAVILDCIDDSARRFYKRWDFAELPGHPYRLFLSAGALQSMMKEP